MIEKAILVDSIVTIAVFKAYKGYNIDDKGFLEKTMSNVEKLARRIEVDYTCNDCWKCGTIPIFFGTCERCGSEALLTNNLLNNSQRQVIRDVTRLYKGEEVVNKELFEKLDIKHVGVLTEFFQNKVNLDFVIKVVNGQKVAGVCYDCGSVVEFDYYAPDCPNCSAATIINY